MFNKVDILDDYYKKNLYTKEDVARFVASGSITAEQYTEITGEEYVEIEVNSVIKDLQTAENTNSVGIVLTGAALLDRIKSGEARLTALEGGN